MKVFALADDATGALETGARFRAAGLPVRVHFSATSAAAEHGLVIDTETRHLPPAEAERCIREIALRARAAGAQCIFKKTDSTLRGPIAAEFRALLEAWPERCLVYVPAYPALGRTVRAGLLLIDGIPLARTAFAADPLNPSTESSVATRLAGCGVDVLLVRTSAEVRRELGPGRVLVCDAETDEDLHEIAASMAGAECVVAGTAAMASAWAGSLSGAEQRDLECTSPAERCLVVCGSLHPASLTQLAESGIPAAFDAPELARLIHEDGWAAFRAEGMVAGEPLAVAAHVGRVVARVVELAAPGCLTIFGGDTTFAVLRELGIEEAEPLGEILTGVAASMICRKGAAMLLVTKAGGFGGPDYLLRIQKILEKR